MAKNWKVASDEYKAHCEELSRIDRIRLALELEEYNATQKYLHHKARHGQRQFIDVLDESIPIAGTSARFFPSFHSLEPRPIGTSAMFTPIAYSAFGATVQIPFPWNTTSAGEHSFDLTTSSSNHFQILNSDDEVPPLGSKNNVTLSNRNIAEETPTQNLVSPSDKV